MKHLWNKIKMPIVCHEHDVNTKDQRFKICLGPKHGYVFF